MATKPPTRKPPPPRLKWAISQQVGGISEIAVLSPIRKGVVPGERRTYEERLRATIANLAQRHQQGIPTELDRMSTIHFGRMIIIRPEQFLSFSKRSERSAGPAMAAGLFSGEDRLEPPDDFQEIAAGTAAVAKIGEQPEPDQKPEPEPEPELELELELRSWLLTLVEFDGEIKSYMREIAHFIGLDFDMIFQNCDLYPGTADFEAFWLWIRAFQINTDLFYAPYRDISVVRIRQLEAFKRRFDAFVARVRSPTGSTVRSMDEMFDEFLRENQQYAAGFPAPGGTYASDKG